MDTQAQVIVVGNGPVGQTTALLLARWGVSVLVLEARTCRDLVGSKAICHQRDVLDIWETIGVGAALADEGVTWSTARTFYRDAELFAYQLPETPGSRWPPFVNVSQSRTEQLLDERMAEQPLVQVHWDRCVQELRQDDDGVEVLCDNGITYHGEYVVLCAGARVAGLREQLSVGFSGSSFEDRFLICDIRADLAGWASERRFYFDPAWNPGRQVLIHPCPDSTFRIDWQVPSDFDLDADRRSGALEARIRAIIGARDYEIIWHSVYRFHSRIADRLGVGRVLLAGDTAHLMAPFGARGLNSGVADAENAAWKIAFALRGWAGPELVASYHHERHAAALENLDVTTATMNFLVPQQESHREHRLDVLRGAASDPELRAQVDSGRLAEPFWLVDSPLTTQDSSRPFAGRPPRGEAPSPAPGVLLPDAAGVRARAREGWLILGADGADLVAAQQQAQAVTRAPVRCEAIDAGLARVLLCRDGELWLIRPDAYVAAVVTDPTDLGVALSRAAGS